MIGHKRRHTVAGRIRSAVESDNESEENESVFDSEDIQLEGNEVPENHDTLANVGVDDTEAYSEDDIFFGGDEICTEELSAMARLQRIEKVTPLLQNWWRRILRRRNQESAPSGSLNVEEIKSNSDTISTTNPESSSSLHSLNHSLTEQQCSENEIADLPVAECEHTETENTEVDRSSPESIPKSKQTDIPLVVDNNPHSNLTNNSTTTTDTLTSVSHTSADIKPSTKIIKNQVSESSKTTISNVVARLTSKTKATPKPGDNTSKPLLTSRKKNLLTGTNETHDRKKIGVNREKLVDSRSGIKSDTSQTLNPPVPRMPKPRETVTIRKPLGPTIASTSKKVVSNKDPQVLQGNRTTSKQLTVGKKVESNVDLSKVNELSSNPTLKSTIKRPISSNFVNTKLRRPANGTSIQKDEPKSSIPKANLQKPLLKTSTSSKIIDSKAQASTTLHKSHIDALPKKTIPVHKTETKPTISSKFQNPPPNITLRKSASIIKKDGKNLNSAVKSSHSGESSLAPKKSDTKSSTESKLQKPDSSFKPSAQYSQHSKIPKPGQTPKIVESSNSSTSQEVVNTHLDDNIKFSIEPVETLREPLEQLNTTSSTPQIEETTMDIIERPNQEDLISERSPTPLSESIKTLEESLEQSDATQHVLQIEEVAMDIIEHPEQVELTSEGSLTPLTESVETLEEPLEQTNINPSVLQIEGDAMEIIEQPGQESLISERSTKAVGALEESLEQPNATLNTLQIEKAKVGIMEYSDQEDSIAEKSHTPPTEPVETSEEPLEQSNAALNILQIEQAKVGIMENPDQEDPIPEKSLTPPTEPVETSEEPLEQYNSTSSVLQSSIVEHLEQVEVVSERSLSPPSEPVEISKESLEQPDNTQSALQVEETTMDIIEHPEKIDPISERSTTPLIELVEPLEQHNVIPSTLQNEEVTVGIIEYPHQKDLVSEISLTPPTETMNTDLPSIEINQKPLLESICNSVAPEGPVNVQESDTQCDDEVNAKTMKVEHDNNSSEPECCLENELPPSPIDETHKALANSTDESCNTLVDAQESEIDPAVDDVAVQNSIEIQEKSDSEPCEITTTVEPIEEQLADAFKSDHLDSNIQPSSPMCEPINMTKGSNTEASETRDNLNNSNLTSNTTPVECFIAKDEETCIEPLYKTDSQVSNSEHTRASSSVNTDQRTPRSEVDRPVLSDIPGNRRLSIPRKRNSMLNLQDTLNQRRLSTGRRKSLDRKVGIKSGPRRILRSSTKTSPESISEQNPERDHSYDSNPSKSGTENLEENFNTDSNECITLDPSESTPCARRSLRSSTRPRATPKVQSEITTHVESKKVTTPRSIGKPRRSRNISPEPEPEPVDPFSEIITIEATNENPLKRKPPFSFDRPLSQVNASYVRAVTKNLTQYNSGYHLSTLQLVPIRMGVPRPPSPTKKLIDRMEQKRTITEIREERSSQEVSNERGHKRVKWDPLLVSIASKKSTPSKAANSSIQTPCISTVKRKYQQSLEHEVVKIQKMIWLEDEQDI